jgi:hypothetical protein
MQVNWSLILNNQFPRPPPPPRLQYSVTFSVQKNSLRSTCFVSHSSGMRRRVWWVPKFLEEPGSSETLVPCRLDSNSALDLNAWYTGSPQFLQANAETLPTLVQDYFFQILSNFYSLITTGSCIAWVQNCKFSIKTLLPSDKTTRHHTPEDHHLNTHRREKLVRCTDDTMNTDPV